MGLDMYLYKCRKMNDFSAMDYYFANEAFGYYEEKELAKANNDNFPFSLSDWDIPETMTEQKLKPLAKDYSKNSTIFETVASWGRANHIHGWFVDNIQNGNDDCHYYFVTEDDLLYLKEICEKVLTFNFFILDKDSYLLYYSADALIYAGITTKKHYSKLEEELNEILPTRKGLCFGPDDYAMSYFLHVEDTLEFVNKILNEADFDKEVYLYHSSW